MKELTLEQQNEVCGGFKFNLGSAFAALVTGFIVGGPVGFGYALGTIVIAQGVNNLEEMVHNEFSNH